MATKKPINQSTKNTIKPELRKERPLGLTGIMNKYNRTRDTRYLTKGQSILLSTYLHEGLTIQGRSMNLDQASRYLRMDKQEMVSRLMGNVTEVLGVQGDQDAGKALSSVLVGALFNGLFADRSLITEQAHCLKSAQGAGYVPFLTRDYNNSLKLLLESHKPFIDLLKTLNPATTPINIQVNNNAKGTVPSEKAINTTQALQLIDNARNGTTLLEDPEAKEALYQSHIAQSQLPEVIATKQLGIGGNRADSLQGTLIMPTPKVRKSHIERNADTILPL